MAHETAAARPGVCNGEEFVTHAGAIPYIEETAEYMFFLRANEPNSQSPNEIDILGGAIHEGEEPEAAARRELAGALLDVGTNAPFQPPELIPVVSGAMLAGVEQNLYWCTLPRRGNVKLSEEGRHLVYLTAKEIAHTDFAYDYRDYAQQVVAAAVKHQQGKSSVASARQQAGELNYPLAYFDLQISFASKWARLTGEDFSQVLAERTAIPRITVGSQALTEKVPYPAEWQRTLLDMSVQDDPWEIAQALYDIYNQQPHSVYTPPNYDFGAFTYTHRPDVQGVQLHFANPQRGQAPLSAEHAAQRQQELSGLLHDVQARHPEAERFIAGSWLFKIPGFRTLFPKNVHMESPPMLSMNGDSLWGQFIDRNGNVSQRPRQQFMRAVHRANSTQDLMEAFPAPVLFTNDKIGKYYEYYSIATKS